MLKLVKQGSDFALASMKNREDIRFCPAKYQKKDTKPYKSSLINGGKGIKNTL